MAHRTILVGLVIGLAAISLGIAVADGVVTVQTKEMEIIVAGTVTARNGALVTVSTPDHSVYTVDAQDATVLLNQLPGNGMSIRVGDRVQAYGVETAPNKLKASKVLVTLPPSEAAAVNSSGAGVGAGPAGDDVQMPAVGDSLGSWRGRGLVVDVKYRDRMITIVTSTGTFVVDAKDATLVKASRSVSIADVNEGDAIRIWGECSGLNRVLADRVEVIQNKNQQVPNVPLRTVAAKGVITNIDFPSFTFKINTGAGELRVLSDENTFIHFGVHRKAFQDLAIGQTVKISGVGNLTSGFAASEIVIVSAPR